MTQPEWLWNLIGWVKRRMFIYGGLFLVLLGVFNLSVHSIALAQPAGVPATQTTDMGSRILEQLLTQVLPLLGGAIGIAFQFARKQGLNISASAEEYTVKIVKSFVENQSRVLYDDIRTNRDKYLKDISQGRMPADLGRRAKESVRKQLEVELRSDEFTSTARKMLTDNLDPLIERYVTQHKNETADKVHELLDKIVPTAVNAALLAYKTPEEAQKNRDTIIKEAFESVTKAFDYRRLLFSHDDAMIRIRSALYEKIGIAK